MPIIANTTSGNTFSAVRSQLNLTTKRMNQFAVNESTLYANTINANVSLKLGGTDIRTTFAQNTYVKSILANTNAYIATKASWASVTGTNTALRTIISDRLQVANAVAAYVSKTLASPASQTVLSNMAFSANVSIAGRLTVTGGITSYFANNVSTGDNMIYLNANSVVSNPDLGFAGNYNDGVYHHAGFFRDASDAGTWKVFENYAPEPDAATAINTAHATFKLAPFSARDARFTGVLSVTANTTVGNTTVGGFLKLGSTDIRATFAQNTSIRLAVADRLQVANAKTYLQVANAKTYLQVANASSTYLTKNNPVITGSLTANGTTGAAGLYLRTSGTGVYWSPASSGGGGGSSNGFSGILVGSNVVVASSGTDRLTLVAGSGITLAANPTTDTITFSSSGGFSGGTVTGATTFTNSTASGNNATGAVKVTGGVGITGNMYTAGRVGYANTASVSVAYTYYNNTTKSLDTVFGT